MPAPCWSETARTLKFRRGSTRQCGKDDGATLSSRGFLDIGPLVSAAVLYHGKPSCGEDTGNCGYPYSCKRIRARVNRAENASITSVKTTARDTPEAPVLKCLSIKVKPTSVVRKK